MADIGEVAAGENIATLGLVIDGSGAETTATRIGETLDQLGQKGDAATQKLSTSQQRLVDEMRRVQAAALDVDASNSRAVNGFLREAQEIQKLATQMQQLGLVELGLSDATQTVLKNQLAAKAYAENLTVARRQLAAETRAAAVAEAQAGAAQAASATGLATIGRSAEGATLPLGRLRQSFASLAAQGTGTSPVIDRIITTLASFGVGNVVVIAALAGIAAISYAWKAMAGGMSEDAKYAEDAIKRLTQEIQRARDAMGTLTTQAADTNLQAAKRALDAAKAKADALQTGRTDATGVFATPGHPADIFLTQGVAPAELDAATKAVKDAQDKYDAAVQDAAHKHADNYAQLVRGNALTHAERVRAIAELAKDQSDLAALAGKTDDADIARRVSLVRDIASLKDALYPKAATGQENRADDTVTRFRDELKQLQSESVSFGKDDTIDRRMAAFVDRINQAETALRRLHQANTGPQIAALEDIKKQVPDLTDAFKAQAQTVFNSSVDAHIRKMEEENAAQVALNVARGQSVEAIDAVMIANAGAIAVEAEQTRALQQHLTLLPEYIARVRELAETHERNTIAAQRPQRLVTAAQDVIGEAQQHAELDTSSPAADLQRVNAYYVDAIEYQRELVRGTTDWKVANEAVNALFRERKRLEVAAATKPLTDIVQPALLTQLQTEIGDAGGTTRAQRAQLDAAMKTAREAALVEAAKEVTATLNDSTKDWDQKYAILQKIHQELQAIGAIKPASDSVLGMITGGLHQLGDLANVFHDAGLANLLNTGGNLVQNVSAAKQVGDTKGFLSAAAIVPDIAVITSVVALASQVFGTNEVMQEWRNIMRQNNQALQNLTVKMEGFIPGSVDNLSAAAQAMRAFVADGQAFQQLVSNETQKGGFLSGHFSDHAGGDLQSQINAMAPFLNQAFGKTDTMDQLDAEWTKLNTIAKNMGVTLTDQWGRIVPKAVQQFVQALNDATQAAFTLTKSFSDQNGLYTLINEANGKTDARASYNAALQAFGVAAPNALAAAGIADPRTAAGLATDNSLASENKLRQFIQSVLAQEKAAVTSGLPFDPSKFGSFTSIQELNNALGTLISPLNQLTNTVNGVTDSLTHVPSGFKVAYDRFLASDRLTQAPTAATTPLGGFTPLPAGSFPNPNAGLTGSSFTTATGLRPGTAQSNYPVAPTPTPPATPTVVYNIQTMTVTTTATNGKELLQQVTAEVAAQSLRGGTTPFSFFGGKGTV